MIVDDHEAIRRLLRGMFEREGLEVSDAINGEECVQKAQEIKPSLIVLDLSMPIVNGLEAARALRSLMPQVPLLMFTNNAAAIVEKEARSAGISAVFCKSDSDSPRHLLDHIRSLLR